MVPRNIINLLLPHKLHSVELTAKAYFSTLIFWQFMVVMLLAGILAPLGFGKVAYSLLLGSIICVFPAGCFAANFFGLSGALAAKQIARAFYRAELIKWLLTAGLFALVFKYVPVEPISLFISFIINQVLLWLVPLLQNITAKVIPQ